MLDSLGVEALLWMCWSQHNQTIHINIFQNGKVEHHTWYTRS